MHILTVIGARPQFIKSAVLSRYIRDNPSCGITETLVHTGQHYDKNMSDIFFQEMDIPHPDINLHAGSGSHGKMTGYILEHVEKIIIDRKPDALLVYGDTNSTLAGALAASKLNIPVAHVEAGLRSYMMSMPEEQNRRLTDHLSTWLFCPTQTAVLNLAKEGIPKGGACIKSTTPPQAVGVCCSRKVFDSGYIPLVSPQGAGVCTLRNESTPSADHKRVFLSGDIMYDASLYYRKKSNNIPETNFILLTIHRAENTDNQSRLKSIVDAVNNLPEYKFIFPIHPRTTKMLKQAGLSFCGHVQAIEPIGYLEMLAYEASCTFIMTDSGGVQKEAFFFRKPCVTLRDSTEWVELVDSGWNALAGSDTEKIVKAVRNIHIPRDYPDLYGDGHCAEKIIKALQE
jgi:UDP-GlcNAc3NAcA epimerase